MTEVRSMVVRVQRWKGKVLNAVEHKGAFGNKCKYFLLMIAVTLLYIFVKLYQIICLKLLIALYIKYIIIKLMKGKKNQEIKQTSKNGHFKWFFSIKTKNMIPHVSNDQIVLSWDNVSKIQNYPASNLVPDQPQTSWTLSSFCWWGN